MTQRRDESEYVDDTRVVGQHAATYPVPADRADQAGLIERQRGEYGGIKWGAGFFGFLTASAMVVLLIVLVAAALVLVGDGTGVGDPGPLGGLVLLVLLLVSYFCGGYVAGRMARFDGGRQGLAVWVWAIVMGLVLAGLGSLVGQRLLPERPAGLPSLAPAAGELGVAIGALAITLAVMLLGAILGGKAGMRFHRRVDRTDLRY